MTSLFFFSSSKKLPLQIIPNELIVNIFEMLNAV